MHEYETANYLLMSLVKRDRIKHTNCISVKVELAAIQRKLTDELKKYKDTLDAKDIELKNWLVYRQHAHMHACTDTFFITYLF